MIKKILLTIIFLIPTSTLAGNLTGYYYTDGGLKVAREDFYPSAPGVITPTCSSCVISRVWDYTSVNQFGAGNETIGGALYLLNGGAADATNVMVSASSMTCPGNTGIVSVAVSSVNVWDTTGRPTQLFNVIYSSMSGTSSFPYAHSEYNEKIWPPHFRDPTGTLKWANRPDHDKYYPVGLVPMEEFAISSFTVQKSSSQAIWIDTYISTTITAGLGTALTGNCSGQITVTEGVSVSTVIPYFIKVYNFNLPDTHNFPTTADVSGTQIDKRFNSGTFDLAGRLHVHQLLHAHGFAWDMGDVPDIGKNYPSAEYTNYLNGSAFTPANGYGNARGVNTGHAGYMIGTYRAWRGSPYTFSDNDAGIFCTSISSWSSNLSTGITSAIYLEDEASTTTLVNSNEKWATWITTSCTMPGALIHSWVTNPAPTAAKYAPHTTINASVSVFGYDPNHPYPNENGFAYSPTSWQIAMNGFLTAGTTQGWRYNDNAFGSGALFAPEEEGYVPRANFWGMWIKLCGEGVSPGTCKGGHFVWQSNYWFDENNYGAANPSGINIFPQKARTFGFTSTQTDTQWGYNGFNYSQMDGVLIWPGTDVLMPQNSYGFEGAIATWQLKMYRRGIDDADVMTMASTVNLALTTTTVHSLITQVMWEVPCTSQLDCTYNSTTDRTWSYNPNAYTTNIETLYQLIVGITPSPPGIPGRSSETLQGTITINGGATLQ